MGDKTGIKCQSGFTLVEVMIAVLIITVGMLGVAALQIASLKNNQSALERSEAVVLTYSIMDRMRANRDLAAAGDYDIAMPGSVAACAGPAGGSLAGNDVSQWIADIQTTFGAGVACGAIDCDLNFNCTITIQWDDSLATQGAANQQLVTEGKI